MKKRSLLITLVALTLLSSMLLSSILGVTKAEYFKTLSKKLDFEVMPDMAFQYLVYDSNGATSSYSNDLKSVSYSPKTGVYQNAKSFVQELVIGGHSPTTDDDTTVPLDGKNVSYGGLAAYKIKIPVDEEGYYSLNFNTHTLAALSGQEDTEFYTVNITYAFGCQVINAAAAAEKGKGTKFDSEPFEVGYRQFKESSNRNTRTTQTTEPIHYADTAVLGGDTSVSTYLWKTTCPYRDERVKLTFKVEEADVEAGYVLWAWDVRGLEGQHGYRIFVDNLSIEKTMELDGTTKYRTNQDPYFMFPQTAYLNNNKVIDGAAVTGKQRVSGGRGTYVTEATANSLGMRAEMLYGSTSDTAVDYTDNPLALYIPLKNIEYDTTYKVTFDFSVARQGTKGPDVNALNGYYNRGNPTDWHNYGGFDTIFNVNAGDNPYMFQSYLHSGLDPILSTNGHSNNQDEIKYADKSYHNYEAESAGETYQYGYPLVKYDEVTKLASINHTTTNSVNNTYCNAYSQNSSNDLEKAQSRNWFNAVQHTEYNGQNKINWITFYNTTFSFNIPEAENSTVKLDELYWVWAINALKYTVFYNIRIDNVRIEKVVKYTSSLYANGVTIGGTRISPLTHAVKYDNANLGYVEEEDTDDSNPNDVQIDVFRSFRGVNGTGQNWQAKGFVLDEGKKTNDKTYNKQTFTADGNIYAPIIDATAFKVKGSNPYKIELSGFAVCEGGVDRYVFSVDGGLTWHDMTFTGNAAGSNQLEEASRGVNQWTSGQTRYEKEDFATYGNHDASKYTHLDGDGEFTEADGANSSFSNFRLSADLKDYATQANLDIIIAAVPAEDISLRCEILRIINFNQVRNYVTFPYEFVSDIEVGYKTARPNKYNTTGLSSSRLNVFRYVDTNSHYNYIQSYAENAGFSMARTWALGTDKPTSTTAYARIQTQSHAYEDIRTAFSDFPVKTTLSITGWALVEGGVDAYYWSADYGKTWNPCSGTPKNIPTANTTDEWVNYKQHFYDNSTSVSTELKTKGVFIDSKNGKYSGGGNNGNKLDANLKDYEGQVVDVIFAAKPVDSDVYVPVGRIDNVGVYGANGLFYTRLHKVFLNETLIKTENRVTTHAGKGSVGDLSRKGLWNYINGSKSGTTWTHEFKPLGYTNEGYTIFEPQNVNPINARSYNTPDFTKSDCQNFIESGGRVTIDGYLFCEGGVERYKYSLDGGITWTVINDAGTNVTEKSGGASTTMLQYAQYTDNTFAVADGVKGDFCCTSPAGDTGDYTDEDMYNHALEFNIPALPEGAVRDLLVVAESTKDKLIPVLNIKIKIKNTNNLTHYGYQRTYGKTSDISDAKWNIDYANSINQNWEFTPNKNDPVNKIMNRVTIPVTEAGDYILNLNHRIQNPPQSSGYTGKQLYSKYEDNTTPTKYSATANTTFKLEKTHYMLGEPINVDFSMKYATGSSGLSNMSILIVNQGWINGHGNRHAIYVINPLETKYKTDGTVNTVNLTEILDDEECKRQNDFPVEIRGQDSLPAGKYNIYFTYQGVAVQYLEGTYPINVTVGGKKLTGEDWILGKAEIYIHDPNETVGLSVIHDGDEYTYYADREKQYSYSDYTTNSNIEPIYNFTNPFDNADLRSISAKVTVTEEDVKRGYIVLDMDYSKLWVASKDPARLYKISNVSSSTTDKSAYFDNQYPEITYKIDFQLDADALVKIDQFNYYDVPFATSGAGHGTVSIMNNVLINTKATNSYELSVNPILNPPIYKGPFNNSTTFRGSYLSVPKTYFNVGEPITVDYNVAGATFTSSPKKSVYMYITSDQECITGRYGDLYVKQVNITKNSTGRITFTADSYNLGDGVYNNANVTAWTNQTTKLNNIRKLPAGEYKVWLINNGGSFDPYNAQRSSADAGLMTEPITIKVIDPENPDLSIALSSNIPHGSNAAHTLPENESVPTEIILDRVVYEKGENVYFKINGSWVRNWVALLKHDVFTGGSVSEEKDGTWSRYAQHGTYDSIVTNNGTINYIKTDTLEPGQYKIVYLFGLSVQNAWNHTVFADRNNSLSKIMAIIDITILPEGTLQQHTVTYTKANGQQGKIDLGTNTLAQSIQTPTYTVVEETSAKIDEIFSNAGYSTNSNDGANYGTKVSLKYKFGNYQVKPAEHNYTVNIPSDMIAGSNNLAYNFSLTTTNVTVYSPQSFNLLCPTYSFRKKSS